VVIKRHIAIEIDQVEIADGPHEFASTSIACFTAGVKRVNRKPLYRGNLSGEGIGKEIPRSKVAELVRAL